MPSHSSDAANPSASSGAGVGNDTRNAAGAGTSNTNFPEDTQGTQDTRSAPAQGAMDFAALTVASAMRRAGLDDWMAEGEGKWSLPIAFLPDGSGWVELMRLSPGVRLGLHRHTGEVHALNLAGERRLNDGRVVRAGDYIHEPAGNVDWWEATGHEDLVVHVVVKGEVEYLGPHRTVLQRITTADRLDDYRRHCAALGVQARAL
jgi:quercetin dioxygenase-like cupin family protein